MGSIAEYMTHWRLERWSLVERPGTRRILKNNDRGFLPWALCSTTKVEEEKILNGGKWMLPKLRYHVIGLNNVLQPHPRRYDGNQLWLLVGFPEQSALPTRPQEQRSFLLPRPHPCEVLSQLKNTFPDKVPVPYSPFSHIHLG